MPYTPGLAKKNLEAVNNEKKRTYTVGKAGKSGQIVKTEQKTKKENIASRLFKGITEPVVTLAVRPYQAYKAVTGATPEEQAVNLPYYGKITSPTTGKDIIKDIGRGIETVSLGIGGGGAQALRQTAGRGLLKLAKTGAIEGAKIGGIYGAGAGIEETGSPVGSVEAIPGALGGAVLGFSTPFVGKVAGKAFKTTTGGLKWAGEKITGFTMNSPESQNARMINYMAEKPTLFERVKGLFTGKQLPTPKKPITIAETAARLVGAGTEKMQAADATRVSNKLWNNLIDPALKNIKENVNMNKFMKELRQDIIEQNPDLARRNQLLKAWSSLNQSYGKITNVSYRKLQDYKSGWTKFLPEKIFRGEPIAGTLNEVRGMAADKARKMIYDKVSPGIKTAYMDWGNLQNLIEEGIKTQPSPEKMSLFRYGWQFALDNLLTPVTTLAGKVLYKTGQGMEFIGDAGAKKVGDIIGSDFFSGSAFGIGGKSFSQ